MAEKGPPESSVILLASRPGVTRDGTVLSRETYIEMQWSRIYQSRPRKILGYRQQVTNLDGKVRQFQTESIDGRTYVHAGLQNLLMRYTINNDTEVADASISRTPLSFVGGDEYGWQFTVMYDTAGEANLIFGSAVPNMDSISNTTEEVIYYGEVGGVDPLEAIADVNAVASGGCVALQNYLVLYGNSGVIKWSVEGEPLDFTNTGSGDARPVGNKIVRGYPIRGQGGAAGIFWSLDSVFLMQKVSGAQVFDFDVLTTKSSILSSNGIVEHNGIFYWATSNGFSMFNGVIRDLPNTFNRLWFLENLNFSQRQKVFATKVPRFNELWFCFPYGDATECTHAVIYNIEENIWYDTELPATKRTAGQYAQIFQYPIMADAHHDVIGSSCVWQHEYGLDELRVNQDGDEVPFAIPAWSTTHEVNGFIPAQVGALGKSVGLSFSYLEPDFDQVGDLTVDMIGRYNARDTPATLQTITLPADPTAGEQLGKFKTTSRLTRFKVMSNVAGGNYIWGSPLLHVTPSDDRKQS